MRLFFFVGSYVLTPGFFHQAGANHTTAAKRSDLNSLKKIYENQSFKKKNKKTEEWFLFIQTTTCFFHMFFCASTFSFRCKHFPPVIVSLDLNQPGMAMKRR